MAEDCGATIVRAERGRGRQLHAGAQAARSDWLLFLHADTVLDAGFEAEIKAFMQGYGRFEGIGHERAAAFRFALDDRGPTARLLASMVALRCAVLGLPYGDQGLLISRAFYQRLGGFSDMPLMEDVDLVRRIGRRRLTMLRTPAVSSAVRYRRDGYAVRMGRNALCLSLYFLGVSPGRIARIYG